MNKDQSGLLKKFADSREREPVSLVLLLVIVASWENLTTWLDITARTERVEHLHVH